MTGMAQPASPLSVSSLSQLGLSLIGIVLLILAISWVIKRLKVAGTRGSGGMAVLDELSVGPRDRIVLIRVGESQVLVGVSAAGLTPLTPLATPILLKGGTQPPAPAFAERLRELMKRPGGVS
jgi:flagellar protein FliO/FliZ